MCRQFTATPTTRSSSSTLRSQGDAGHVHLLELDVVIGARFLVTVHGPLNPVVPVDAALVETRGTLARIEAGRFRPHSPTEVAYAVLSGVARRQRGVIGEVAEKIPGLRSESWKATSATRVAVGGAVPASS